MAISLHLNSSQSLVVVVEPFLLECQQRWRDARERELNLMCYEEPTRLLSFLYGTGEVRLGPNFFYRFSAFWLRSSVVSVLISLISDTLLIE